MYEYIMLYTPPPKTGAIMPVSGFGPQGSFEAVTVPPWRGPGGALELELRGVGLRVWGAPEAGLQSWGSGDNGRALSRDEALEVGLWRWRSGDAAREMKLWTSITPHPRM